ncbi:MAG: tyrosine--tRNA ligase, partial [Acidimicrobiales bacterium]
MAATVERRIPVFSPTMDVLADMEARGLLHDTTGRTAMAARLAAGPITLYCGFDPTADSLHIGNLIGLLALRRFQAAGHRPIALAGGATGMIGDPSGRSDERKLLDDATLSANLAAIREQIGRILGSAEGWVLVDNREWTGELRLLDFLRDVGKHVTVNQMMAKESVRTRLQGEAGISYTEFTYMLLQAHDYLWLHEHHGCELQVGGSDQWGNITAGIDLIRRRASHAVHGLTWPLWLRSDGEKFGKSATGDNLWLGAHRTSPYQFFQYWMHVPDADARRFLLQLTLLPVPEVEAIVASHGAAPERREGQRALAREVTTVVHGAGAAAAAEAASAVLFGSDLDGVDPAVLAMVAEEVPTTTIDPERLIAGIDVVELLVETGLVLSKT